MDLEKGTNIYVSQNQPKMLVISEAVEIAIEASIEKPQLRKISFKTANGNRFYMEVALGKINFYSLFPIEQAKEFDVDDIVAAGKR